MAKKRVIVITPTDYLVGQTEEVLLGYHKSVTAASSNRTSELGKDILVTTAFSAAKYVESYDVIIIDENQHTGADTWLNLLGSCEKPEYVYSFTATAFREDGLDLVLHAFCGPTVYEKDTKWGIQSGWLEHFDAYQIRLSVKNEKGREIAVHKDANPSTAYKKLVNFYTLGIIKQKLLAAIAKDRMCLVLFKNLPQANMLAQMLKNDYPVKVANANFKKPLDDFKKKKTKVLLATDRLVSEGVNIPDIDVLFLVTQHGSRIITYQSIGRILRKGQKKPMVLDFACMGYEQYENGANKRLAIYQEIADTTNVMEV